MGHWRWWYAVVGVALSLGLLFALVLLGWVGVWGQVAQFLMFIAVALAVPWAIGRRALAADWGWVPARPWRTAVVVAVLAVVTFAVVEAIEAVDPAAAQASATVMRSFGLGHDTVFDLALVLCIVALAPLGEELLFRGLIYRSLRDGLARHGPLGWGVAVGAAVSAGCLPGRTAARGRPSNCGNWWAWAWCWCWRTSLRARSARRSCCTA